MAEINSTTGHESEVIDVQGLKASLQKLKTNHIDKKANTSSLGTAATKNVPASGNAGDTEVVMGNDTRLSDSRKASDVFAWAKAASKPTYTASEVGAIPTGEKGAANGVASLDSSGKVPQSQLPSYVDDVLEYDTKSAFPETGEGGKIYVDKSNSTTWRWSGSTYTQIKGDLAIGTTTGTAADGKVVNDHINNTSIHVTQAMLDRIVYLENKVIYNSHAYVDLGLPSGTKWATMNVGASSETDYGNYYQYGKGAAQYAETSGNINYMGTEDPLDSSVDTAVQVWGGSWHMPTRAQMQELTANTTYQWVTDYKGSGINGGTFTATNGAVLFFPAAGDWDVASQSNVGDYGLYWGSSPSGRNDAYYLYFGNGINGVNATLRRSGFSVRPVVG